ncbi:LCP family protein [Streptomyces sp. NPDC059009]|uniref:LCP family protein n=1 Tax=Streptomyces sp. NPDC059009 TaxID=3346694 RepID=UPI003696A021
MTKHKRRRKHRAARRRRSAAVRLSWAVIGTLSVVGTGACLMYAGLNGNIDSVDIDRQLGDDRPRATGNGLSVLVLGSDSRSGDNQAYGRDEGSARSDTAMVLHLYPGRRSATVISIPRDTLVDRPVCPTRDGASAPARRRAMFNTAYSVGGPACTVKTVESMSGIRMDHFVELDFTGFKKLVDAFGGVPMDIERSVKDKASGLDVSAGRHILDGEQALALVRTRKAVGDGSDLGRIRLQQAFITALLRQVGSIDVLDNPKKAYALADTATKSLTTDAGLASVKSLLALAQSVKAMETKNIRMLTLPVTPDRKDPNRVVPLEDETAELWQRLRAEREVAPRKEGPRSSPS